MKATLFTFALALQMTGSLRNILPERSAKSSLTLRALEEPYVSGFQLAFNTVPLAVGIYILNSQEKSLRDTLATQDKTQKESLFTQDKTQKESLATQDKAQRESINSLRDILAMQDKTHKKTLERQSQLWEARVTNIMLQNNKGNMNGGGNGTTSVT